MPTRPEPPEDHQRGAAVVNGVTDDSPHPVVTATVVVLSGVLVELLRPRSGQCVVERTAGHYLVV